jgi:glycosyltransferase involved in cell wall biosynthesis
MELEAEGSAHARSGPREAARGPGAQHEDDPQGPRRPRRPRVLVVPAYNEAVSLPTLLQALRRKASGYELVVVDDGSGDETAAIARRDADVVLRHPFNLGYGAALQTAYKYALRHGAELLVQMDADGQHAPEEIATLVAPVEADELDLVVGSRFLEERGYRMGRLRRLGRDAFRGLARLGGMELTDPTSGFQAMNRRALVLFQEDWWPADYPDVDVLLIAHRAGLRVGERPVHMGPSPRASTLHSGWKPLYYVYKMLLSLWAASGDRRSGPMRP